MKSRLTCCEVFMKQKTIVYEILYAYKGREPHIATVNSDTSRSVGHGARLILLCAVRIFDQF